MTESESTPKKKRPRIVTIGGGTGSFTLLSGLKHHPVHISAIVSMADDGGSTGVLRDEIGALPPGDVRQCLAALARASDDVRDLFNYRFREGGLEGHNAGNLFLSALEKVTGSFTKAVAVAGNILNVYGRVIPVSEGDMRLIVTLNNGATLRGQSKLDDESEVRTVGVRDVTLAHPVPASDDALKALQAADVVVLGPGDVHGSVIPNLLVDGIGSALHDTPARIVVVANVTNKKGLTDGFTACDYARVFEAYLHGRTVDAIVCNTATPSPELMRRYEEQEGADMMVSCTACRDSHHRIAGNFVRADAPRVAEGDRMAETRSFIRHESDALARAIVEYAHEGM